LVLVDDRGELHRHFPPAEVDAARAEGFLLLEEDGAARRFHQQRLGQDAGQSKHALRGAAAPLFLFGGALKGGLVGKHPSLTKLERGDLVHHTDFRSVYATLLEH
jgi:hypothetical protein